MSELTRFYKIGVFLILMPFILLGIHMVVALLDLYEWVKGVAKRLLSVEAQE